MNNKKVGLLFAKGEENGKTPNLFIDGNVVYSYGYHFPIALRLKDNGEFRYILNSDGYSNTTARHKNIIKNAVGENNILFFVDTNKLKNIISLNVKEYKELILLNLE